MLHNKKTLFSYILPILISNLMVLVKTSLFGNELFHLQSKILIPTISLLLLILLLLNSYTKYLQKLLIVDSLLKEYHWDKLFGFYRHNKSNEPICTNCLHTLQKPIPLNYLGDSYICKIKNCTTNYYKHITFHGDYLDYALKLLLSVQEKNGA